MQIFPRFSTAASPDTWLAKEESHKMRITKTVAHDLLVRVVYESMGSPVITRRRQDQITEEE